MDTPKKKRDPSAARPVKSVKEKKEASPKREASVFPLDHPLIIRLAASSLIFAFVLISNLSSAIDTLLLIAAALLSGYDILIQALGSLLSGNFTDEPVLVSLASILSFPIGFGEEGAAVVILYQAFRLLITVIENHVSKAALDRIPEGEGEIRALAEEQLKNEGASDISFSGVMRSTISPILTAAVVIAVVYAVVLPLFMHYNVRVAVHRAITIILISTPFSILAAMPSIGKIAMGFAASSGTVFKRASDLESMDGTRTVIMEKSCFPGRKEAKIISYSSPNLDDRTFFLLICHLVRNSEQEFARVLLKNLDAEYIPGLISDFTEGPGGVEAVFNGTEAVLGTRSYLSELGLSAPAVPEDLGIYYYLFVGRRYGGTIILSEDGENDIGDIVHDLRFTGINKCVLLCSEGAEEVSEFSQKSDFDEVFAGINAENHQQVVDELCAADSNKKVYVKSDDVLGRSRANLEIRVGNTLGETDAVIFPQYYAHLPMLFTLSKRMHDVALENSILAFAVKIVLIFFSMIGYCNLWIAITADMAAAIVTILNANRVTSNSLIRTFLDK